MSEKLELLPCPFCGAPARILPHLGGPGCPYATCSAECYIGDLAMMAEDWNRRTPPPAPAWTGEPPKVPGGYWHEVEGRKVVMDITARDIATEPFSRWPGRWAGPIPEQPEGEKS